VGKHIEDSLVTVHILDKEYHVRSDQADTIREVADYLNGLIASIKEGTPVMNRVDLVVMAAFKAASDYYTAKAELNRLKEQVEDQASALSAKIELNLSDQAAVGEYNAYDPAGGS
jgi:cell division protein ZapA (FtsZ GTPase activity inhibitor)